MVAALGGPADFMTRSDAHLAKARVVRPCTAERSGFVAAMDVRQIGIAAVNLGAGRHLATDPINHGGRLHAISRRSAVAIAAGEPLAMVHAASEADADAAVAALRGAIRIADTAPAPQPVVRARIDADAAKAKVA